MFTNKILTKFFTNGQVIETFRGKGVFQPAIDEAVKLLQQGEWVSLPRYPLSHSLTPVAIPL